MKKDIFDRIMELKVFSPFYPFYKQYKEGLLYLFFGGLTFLVSVSSYSFFIIAFHMETLIANFFSWVLAVLFAYVTNRVWVFSSKNTIFKDVVKELFDFTLARVTTLVVEEIILYIFISKLQFNGILIKVIAQIVVIVLNYLISKFFVFNKE